MANRNFKRERQGKPVLISGENAALSYEEVRVIFFHRTGQLISVARVWQHLVSAHRKLAMALEELKS